MIATLYILSIKYIVILVAIIGVYFVIKKPLYALYILVFTFPFKNFYIWIGTDLQIWKLLSIAFLIFQTPKWILQVNKTNKIDKVMFIFLSFIIYVLFISIINTLFINPDNTKEMLGGYFKNEGRIFFQIIFFLITVNLVFIPINVLKTFTDIVKIIKVLLFAIIVLAVLGFVQYLIVHLVGVDPFPIKGVNEVHSGFVLGIRDSIFRINSWAGEPKHMAIAMVIGITIILLSRVYNLKIIKYDLLILGLFVFNLIFTYSTTGYVWVGIVLILIVFIRGILNWRSLLLMGIVGIIGLFMVLNMSTSMSNAMGKQIARAGIEIQDETIKSYFLDEPQHALIGTGLGNIHHYAVKYFPVNFPLFKDTPYKANSGFLFMLADFGLIGILLLYLVVGLLLQQNIRLLQKIDMKEKKEILVLVYLTAVFSILFLSRYNELFFILLGVMFAINKKLKNIEIKKG